MSKFIITKTPLRISFFGGGTDFPSFYKEHGGAVLSTTIDKFCYILFRNLPPHFPEKSRIHYSKIEKVNKINEIEHPAVKEILNYYGLSDIELHYFSDMHAKGGMASSSAFCVGLIMAIKEYLGEPLYSLHEVANRAIYIEQELLKENVGVQDQIACAVGGFNLIEFGNNGWNVSNGSIPFSYIENLNRYLCLFNLNQPRLSSDINSNLVKNILSGEKVKQLLHLKDMVYKGFQFLKSGHYLSFGELLDEAWRFKKECNPLATTPEIDEIYYRGKSIGALGGKVLGAGGGGSILFFIEPILKNKLIEEFSNELFHINFKFYPYGSMVIKNI